MFKNILKRLPLGIKFILLILLVTIILSFVDSGRTGSIFFIGKIIITGWKAFAVNLLFLILTIIWLIGLIRLKKYAIVLGIIIGFYGILNSILEITMMSTERILTIMQLSRGATLSTSPNVPVVTIGRIIFSIPLIFFLWMTLYMYRRKNVFKK